MLLRSFFLFLCTFYPGLGLATDIDFVRDVRPIFEQHCYSCHGPDKHKSGLRLDIKQAALKGGDNHGPDILPGNAADSPLIHFIRTDNEDELMPPKGKLSDSDIQTLTRWINAGAPWPDGVDLAQLEDKTDHWAFKPLRPSPPAASIDSFIDAKLAEHQLQRSPPASPIAWLRRVTFDLTGLPPSPTDIAAFATLPDHAAAVERLLASPRYGERWAQHWLDVVRYADTHGFEVNTERPNAWPYRDYVIRAFNQDTPYDLFIKQQIAGDAMNQDAATGFLVTASVLLPGQIGKDEPSKRLARQDAIDEIVVNIGQTFLGLSIGCARCHDHKFDPITAHDYYAMQAFVAGVDYADRPLRSPEADAARAELSRLQSRLSEIDQHLASLVPLALSGSPRPMINARQNVDRFPPITTQRLRFTILSTNQLEPCIDELEVFTASGQNIARQAKITTSGDRISPNRHHPDYLNDGHYGNSSSWMSNEVGKGWVELTFAQPETIESVVWGRDRQGKFTDRLATQYQIEALAPNQQWQTLADASDRPAFDPAAPALKASLAGLSPDETRTATALHQEKTKLENRISTTQQNLQVFAGQFRTPDPIHLLNRGDPEQPTHPVPPAVPTSLGSLELPIDAPDLNRRQTLANWIADPKNPLTARVMVNRIWQGHFGTGLVATPSDFGRSGTPPSHPELLDWLASEFISHGWSIKHIHRLITLSAAYRQSSASTSSHALTFDAESRLLWRFPSRRLEAESIRDSILAVSGQLNLSMHGRGFNLFDKRGGLSGFNPIETFTADNQRRMIYSHKVRREPEAVFGAFDCPDAGQSTARRIESTTPIQALNLFNSPFTLHQAIAFAQRIQRETSADPSHQITLAYQLAFNRSPTAEELAEAQPIIQHHGLSTLCRALFNANEFLFLP
jgi:hypothetical protein